MGASNQHLYWIGGSPCGGKSSVADILTRQCNLDLYRIDDQMDRLMQSITPEGQPTLTQWQAQSWEQRWMQPIDDLLTFVLQAYDEALEFCLQEIKTIPDSQPTLIEGNPLRPGHVKALAASSHHAIWLIAEDHDLKHYYHQRSWAKEIVNTCSQPDQAFENWIQRDIHFAHQINQECVKENFIYLMSERNTTIMERARQVAAHFQLTCDL